jgi:hypothetical protein
MKHFTKFILSAVFATFLLSAQANAQNTPVTNTTDGCDLYFKSQRLCAILGWQQEPSPFKDGRLEMIFWDYPNGLAQHLPFVDPDADQIRVQLWVPEQNQPPVEYIAQQETKDGYPVEGKYLATGLYFDHPGKWEITVQFLSHGQPTASGTLYYTVLK